MASNNATVDIKLRTVAQLRDAHEWLFNQQKQGGIDAKTADALNTTLKGAVYLGAALPLKALDLVIKARTKKVDIPEGMLPELASEVPKRES